jgi:hypothetical protein
MELTIENFRNIKVKQLDPGNFIEKNRWNQTMDKLNDLKLFIDEMLRITKSDITLPQKIVAEANSYAIAFISYVKQITEETKGQPAEIANKKEQIIKQFEGWYRECIEKTNGRADKFSFYDTFNTLKNLEKNNFESERVEIGNIKSKISTDKDSIDKILKELQKKTSSVTMSDYAKIFKDESDGHNLSSWIWLAVGITIAILFLVLLFCTELYDKFPTEEVLSDGKSIKYNLSNALIKVLIFAVQIFLISFSFKQYSISRHLKTINKHRQNGLDSFKLFVESINKEDTETRNSLMLQLAKAIYEQSATGYISDKNQNVNSGIVEITKMIGANKLD